jgi:hypothetical protein
VATQPNELGVSTAFPPDIPQAGSYYAFFGDGLPIENFISQTFATNINDLYTLAFYVAILADNVTDTNGKVFGEAPQIDVGWRAAHSSITLTGIPTLSPMSCTR